MTSFERDYKDVLEGNEVEVFKRRKKEIKELEKKLRETRNGFRDQCIFQELEKK
ncbi:hypothetical protein [Facklamia sp. P12950]|uniref:hypothetical protein n=1 Tax=Facklamia sp. P12950 TaxID=3421951 RepID=UPI003D175CCF